MNETGSGSISKGYGRSTALFSPTVSILIFTAGWPCFVGTSTSFSELARAELARLAVQRITIADKLRQLIEDLHVFVVGPYLLV